MTSPDVFSWLRGLKAGNWPGRDAAYAHPAQVRLWPLALDTLKKASDFQNCPLCGAARGMGHYKGCELGRFENAAEKERA